MTRDDVRKQFPDATDEQVKALLDMHTANIGRAKKVTAEELTPEIERLREIEQKYQESLKSKMSEEDKLQAALDRMAEMERNSKLVTSRMAVEKELLAAGLKEDEYSSVIDTLVSEDSEKAVSAAKGWASILRTKSEEAEKAARERLMKDTPAPSTLQSGNSQGAEKAKPAESVASKINNFVTEQVRG